VVDDVLAVADVPDGAAFAAESLRRFADPALRHTCRQVGADGSQKLPQRLLPVVAARRRRGLPTDRLAQVVAGWQLALASGQVEDPVGSIELDRDFGGEVAATLDVLRQRT
jgi:fructuronate reductase